MTKEEFIKEMCVHCIYQECNRNVKSFKDKFGKVQYSCGKYKSMFECCMKDCNSCGRCR